MKQRLKYNQSIWVNRDGVWCQARVIEQLDQGVLGIQFKDGWAIHYVLRYKIRTDDEHALLTLAQ